MVVSNTRTSAELNTMTQTCYPMSGTNPTAARERQERKVGETDVTKRGGRGAMGLTRSPFRKAFPVLRFGSDGKPT